MSETCKSNCRFDMKDMKAGHSKPAMNCQQTVASCPCSSGLVLPCHLPHYCGSSASCFGAWEGSKGPPLTVRLNRAVRQAFLSTTPASLPAYQLTRKLLFSLHSNHAQFNESEGRGIGTHHGWQAFMKTDRRAVSVGMFQLINATLFPIVTYQEFSRWPWRPLLSPWP